MQDLLSPDTNIQSIVQAWRIYSRSPAHILGMAITQADTGNHNSKCKEANKAEVGGGILMGQINNKTILDVTKRRETGSYE